MPTYHREKEILSKPHARSYTPTVPTAPLCLHITEKKRYCQNHMHDPTLPQYRRLHCAYILQRKRDIVKTTCTILTRPRNQYQGSMCFSEFIKLNFWILLFSSHLSLQFSISEISTSLVANQLPITVYRANKGLNFRISGLVRTKLMLDHGKTY